MPKLYSSKYILKILQKKGFFVLSQKGSHIKLRTEKQPQKTTIVPASKKEIPYGTFQAILIQSGLDKDDFEK